MARGFARFTLWMHGKKLAALRSPDSLSIQIDTIPRCTTAKSKLDHDEASHEQVASSNNNYHVEGHDRSLDAAVQGSLARLGKARPPRHKLRCPASHKIRNANGDFASASANPANSSSSQYPAHEIKMPPMVFVCPPYFSNGMGIDCLRTCLNAARASLEALRGTVRSSFMREREQQNIETARTSSQQRPGPPLS